MRQKSIMINKPNIGPTIYWQLVHRTGGMYRAVVQLQESHSQSDISIKIPLKEGISRASSEKRV